MPAIKSDIYIIIKAGEKTFRIGGLRLPNGRYAIKRGRSWSHKTPQATLTEIFAQARKWAVRHI
ncbi:MAG: hypothetical protein A2Y38_12345 [Spirochaetes bacterium GWB1_59_5]|nr:MAG: hypothetical protein A2Y38_12345 [Spirochaetes bacterium GWB1_59_5]